MNIGSLFSGYGGLELGVQEVLGGTVAWHSEIDPGACKILAHRYPDVPNLGDITAVNWTAVEPVDVLTGGFPCQDLSLAGLRKGLRPDTRSGLWTQFAYAIDQLRPSLVVAENVRGLLSAEAHSDLEPCPWCVGDGGGVPLRALGAVLGDLADLGYDARWFGLRASDVGAPHGRFRVFVAAWPAADAGRLRGQQRGLAAPGEATGRGALAVLGERRRVDVAPHASSDGRHEGWTEPARLLGGSDAAECGAGSPADPDGDGLEGVRRQLPRERDADGCSSTHTAWGDYEPAIRRWERRLGRPAPVTIDYGKNGQPRLSPAFVEFLMGLPAGWVTDVPGVTRNEQLKALGNGVVPQQAAAALRLLLPQIAEAAA
jgi:DNA (cytosine-5)-methyltransferase 1